MLVFTQNIWTSQECSKANLFVVFCCSLDRGLMVVKRAKTHGDMVLDCSHLLCLNLLFRAAITHVHFGIWLLAGHVSKQGRHWPYAPSKLSASSLHSASGLKNPAAQPSKTTAIPMSFDIPGFSPRMMKLSTHIGTALLSIKAVANATFAPGTSYESTTDSKPVIDATAFRKAHSWISGWKVKDSLHKNILRKRKPSKPEERTIATDFGRSGSSSAPAKRIVIIELA